MSVEQIDVIDAIGVDGGGVVHLTISDHLAWNGAHLSVLQAKLNAYLRFIESGEIYASYPSAKGRNIAIDVVLRHRPSEAGSKFLDQAHGIVVAAGFGFSYAPLSGGFVEDDA